jgi:hypothetical protein
VREIEIVGDKAAAEENWQFEGPFKRMTFASRMQHKIYWGSLKRPIEWSLKTWLAPWAYIASVLYHDTYWYPRHGKRRVQEVLHSDWGRLFHNWERLTPDDRGWEVVGDPPPGLARRTGQLLGMSFKILGTCLREAPEFATRRRRKTLRRE